MTHVFDYRDSTPGQIFNLYYLLGAHNGAAVLPVDFWSTSGTAHASYTYQAYVTDAAGYSVERTLTGVFHVDVLQIASHRETSSAATRAAIYDGMPYYLDPSLIPATSRDLTIATMDGNVLTFAGLGAPTRVMPAFAPRHFPLETGPDLAVFDKLHLDFLRDYAEVLRGVEQRKISDAGVIRLDTDTGMGAENRLRVLYTPDPDSDIRIGDLLSLHREGEMAPVDFMVMTPEMSQIYEGEEVHLLLTRGDDNMMSIPFRAALLEVSAGAGDDNLQLITPYQEDIASTAKRLLMRGEAGHDIIAVTLHDEAVLYGGAGDDVLSVSNALSGENVRVRPGLVEIHGEAGDDQINGTWESRAVLYGGAGADFLQGGLARDRIYGGAQNDRIIGSGFNDEYREIRDLEGDLIYGEEGDDDILGSQLGDTLYGGAGDDSLTGDMDLGSGDDMLYGGAGRDRYYFSRQFGHDTLVDDGGILMLSTLFGGMGLDGARRSGQSLILDLMNGSSLTLIGFYNNPIGWRIEGTDLGGTFSEASAPFSLAPFLGRDLNGTAAAETLYGAMGDDTLSGRAGDDLLVGHEGHDLLYGGDGRDTLNGGIGNDSLYGGETEADLRDLIYGGDGEDVVDAGWGNDEVHGGAGADQLYGGFGADTVIGNQGDDLIAGGAGADVLFGNDGNDSLNGGYGSDALNGGAGADVFIHLGILGHGSDWVQDYVAAQGDVLQTLIAGARHDQFQVNFATTGAAGRMDLQEAFVIYKPSGQILWALVDGAAQAEINLQINGVTANLLA